MTPLELARGALASLEANRQRIDDLNVYPVPDGDTGTNLTLTARAIADDQPIKFAAMECVQKTSTHVTEYIFGRCTSSGVKGGIGIPGLDSFLVGWSTNTKVTGLDTVPADDRPPANTMLQAGALIGAGYRVEIEAEADV